MDSNEYYNNISHKIKSSKINTNYCRTVGRQLGIFSSPSKIKSFIESKAKRIYEDHECMTDIKWTNNKNKEVKINKKQEIQFPSSYIKENQFHFLTDIPYGLALYYHSESKKQKLYSLSFIQWLDFFSFVFFKTRIIDDCMQLEKLEDTLFPNVIEENYYFKAKKTECFSEKNESIHLMFFEHERYHIIYFRFDKRHLLFRKKL